MSRMKGGHNKEYYERKVERYFDAPTDRKAFLQKHWPFMSVPSLDTKMTCCHCRDVYDMAEFKVHGHEWRSTVRIKREMLIVCKNHETCGGTAFEMLRATDKDIKAGRATFEV